MDSWKEEALGGGDGAGAQGRGVEEEGREWGRIWRRTEALAATAVASVGRETQRRRDGREEEKNLEGGEAEVGYYIWLNRFGAEARESKEKLKRSASR